jgi:hypothetical protein
LTTRVVFSAVLVVRVVAVTFFEVRSLDLYALRLRRRKIAIVIIIILVVFVFDILLTG